MRLKTYHADDQDLGRDLLGRCAALVATLEHGLGWICVGLTRCHGSQGLTSHQHRAGDNGG